MAVLDGRALRIQDVRTESREKDSSPELFSKPVEFSLTVCEKNLSVTYGQATRSVEPEEAEAPLAVFPSAWRAWRRFFAAFS